MDLTGGLWPASSRNNDTVTNFTKINLKLFTIIDSGKKTKQNKKKKKLNFDFELESLWNHQNFKSFRISNNFQKVTGINQHQIEPHRFK